MKRVLFFFFLLVSSAMIINAQTGLEINSIFNGRYASDPNVTETLISGKNKFLQKHKLNVLATFKGPATSYRTMVERMVLADASKALGKSVRYKDGRLYFGLFILKPIVVNNIKMNRYLYYLDNSTHKNPTVLVVYLEGTLNEQQVSDFIQSLTTKSK